MVLINSKELFKFAQQEKFAIPATNFINLNSARAFVDVAEERGLPLILPFAQSHKELISLEEAAIIGKYLAEKASVPVVLHLDHGEDIDFIRQAIDLGFTSVMIDASKLPFKENITVTKEVVNYAHQFDVTVEAELGHVGANENFESHEEVDSIYTEVNDVIEFVEKTKVDSLAISIGTAHGVYKGEPHINFERLNEIKNMTDVPLVLHGGSSSGDKNLKRCAGNGITKINIFTDFLNAAYNSISNNTPKNYLEMISLADEGMKKILHHYYNVFQTKPVTLS